ncbi:DUF3592 domain-containing protein [Myxococcota bacterium]|nr:DUF3592 domain-containing protein [Myxococcota bacterium]MBU1512139.1 DUF3592 domain-containing protein [Myxococcota bacterium]
MAEKKPLSNRQILTVLAAVTAALAVGSLLLGLLTGHALLLRMGLVGFAASLDEIPVGSAVVTTVVSPLLFVIGVGLLWKGICESLARDVVTGTIRSSSCRLIPSDDQDEYRLHSTVRYVVDGVPLEAEGPHAVPCLGEDAANRRMAGLRAGDPVEVWYKPGDPVEVFLDAPPERTLTLRLLGAWITLTGLFAMFLNGVVFAG